MPFDLAASLSQAETIRFQASTWAAVPSLKPAQGEIDDLIAEAGTIVTDVTTARDAAEGLYRADLDAALAFAETAQALIEAL